MQQTWSTTNLWLLYKYIDSGVACIHTEAVLALLKQNFQRTVLQNSEHKSHHLAQYVRPENIGLRWPLLCWWEGKKWSSIENREEDEDWEQNEGEGDLVFLMKCVQFWWQCCSFNYNFMVWLHHFRKRCTVSILSMFLLCRSSLKNFHHMEIGIFPPKLTDK